METAVRSLLSAESEHHLAPFLTDSSISTSISVMTTFQNVFQLVVALLTKNRRFVRLHYMPIVDLHDIYINIAKRHLIII